MILDTLGASLLPHSFLGDEAHHLLLPLIKVSIMDIDVSLQFLNRIQSTRVGIDQRD
jgi:hypothetical protein